MESSLSSLQFQKMEYNSHFWFGDCAYLNIFIENGNIISSLRSELTWAAIFSGLWRGGKTCMNYSFEVMCILLLLDK